MKDLIETIKIIALRDLCNALGVDYSDFCEFLANTHVSWGTNPDTLLDAETCAEFLREFLSEEESMEDFTYPSELSDVWVSLGS